MPLWRFLLLSGNSDRWGALAVGIGKTPSVQHITALKLDSLPLIISELNAISEHRPSVDEKLRKRLVQTVGVGGARPKATVQDETGQYWLVKPQIATDVADIPRLEHMAQQWGAASGLDFAQTVFHAAARGRSAIRILRFDREHKQRRMCVSAASLLQAEYPGGTAQAELWSYPRLAEELRLIGAPAGDRIELFGRMIFNAVCGNDDDHVRNHAVVYRHDQKRWRLAPAFDVVPNPVEMPRTLMLQLSIGRFDICRAAALADARRFGFASREEAERYLDDLLVRIRAGFDSTAHLLEPHWQELLLARLRQNSAALGR